VPVNQNNYDHRGGGNYGIVLRCPRIVADRLVYFDFNQHTEAWVIRDFIVNKMLRSDASNLTRAQIEADATLDEFPAWCNVEENPDDWAAYLRLRTTALLRLRTAPSNSGPNPASGTWHPL
jgi:hypothetical protein